jgi:hypothetical protein
MIKQDYKPKNSGTKLTDQPEQAIFSNIYWAAVALIISGFLFAIAVFGVNP